MNTKRITPMHIAKNCVSIDCDWLNQLCSNANKAPKTPATNTMVCVIVIADGAAGGDNPEIGWMYEQKVLDCELDVHNNTIKTIVMFILRDDMAIADGCPRPRKKPIMIIAHFDMVTTERNGFA